VTMLDHVQGYQAFANQGEKVNLTGVTKVVDGARNTIYQQPPGRDRTRVFSPAEGFLITDVLKDYQNQWGLGWNRQMASKSGTSGGTQVGVHPDAWMMAYNPAIVVGTWAGNTGADGQGRPTSAFGVNVGSTALAAFINSLPREYTRWYQRPEGIVQSKRSNEIFLGGTENSTCASQKEGEADSGSPGQKNKKKKDEEGGG
jgi:membrane peptidoglycan carboxypeptidase